MKRLLAILFILTLALLSGCGRKTPPVPPQAVVATAITDLRCQLDDQAATLTWTRPRLSINGARIDTIRSFIVYKARISAADYCRGCPVVFNYTFEVDGRGAESSRQVSYRDTDLESGYHYVYMVRSNSGWRILSKDSNHIDFQHRPALLPPPDIQVEIGDSTLTLSWSPIGQRSDGSQVTGLEYQVYRSPDNKNFRPLGLPMPGHSFIDPSVTNGRTYYYQVRAVLSEQGLITLGSASQTAIGTPVDLTPPAPPSQLTVVQHLEGIQLHWRSSTAADVAGYHIYRKGAEGTWQRLASTKAGAITYTDRTDLAAGVYDYRITAFDKGVRHNESEPTKTVSYTKP